MAVHVVLVHPEIHWNTGNAGRCCLAVDATLHLVEPLGFSLDEREVRRAGLDYRDHVDSRLAVMGGLRARAPIPRRAVLLGATFSLPPPRLWRSRHSR